MEVRAHGIRKGTAFRNPDDRFGGLREVEGYVFQILPYKMRKKE
jgi:hypothetical protein